MRIIKNSYKIVVLLLVLTVSCQTEEELDEFKIITLNDSQEQLVFELFDERGDSFDSYLLSPQQSETCSYFSSFFQGYSGCDQRPDIGSIDSIVVKFSNGKGYIDAVSSNADFSFPRKFLFQNNDETFEQITDYEFRFTITQEDFDNAFELPE